MRRHQTKLALVCRNMFNLWHGQNTLGARLMPTVSHAGMLKQEIATFTYLCTRERKAKLKMLYGSLSKMIMKSTIWLTV